MAARTTLTCVTATLAAIVMFAGVTFLMIVIGLCPLDVELSRMELVQRWGVGGLLALAAAVYSFRATVKAQKPEYPVESSTKVAEVDDTTEKT
jgi:hypothetical protein